MKSGSADMRGLGSFPADATVRDWNWLAQSRPYVAATRTNPTSEKKGHRAMPGDSYSRTQRPSALMWP